ncbi:MAG: hypothetical protein J7M38_11480 [Armatimonadetes bacterium]|nr:hypothetical protein [Armatimonadota bacterium]
MANTIKLKKYSDIIEEYEAGGTITPGMLIMLNSSGKVVPHGNAGEFAEKMFALENELEGKGIDDNYSSGDRVQCWIAGRGDQVYAILADGQTANIGDILESDGAGHLQVAASETASAATYPGSVVGVALEAVTTSGSTARIKIRVV